MKEIRRISGPLLSFGLHLLLILGLFSWWRSRPPAKEEGVELEMGLFEEAEEPPAPEEAEAPPEEEPQEEPQPEELPAEEVLEEEELPAVPQVEESPPKEPKKKASPPAKEIFKSRSSSKARKNALRKFGGSPAVEEAVLKGLRWLKEHQNEDGSWSRAEAPAMTGLALLAYLAHGETPASEEFGKTVQSAMDFLIAHVERANGPDADYRNGIIACALAEGYGFCELPALREPARKCIGWIVAGQQENGGFDYNYKKEQRWDLSIACWQYQALHAAMIADLKVRGTQNALERGVRFIREVTYSAKNHRFGYSSPGKGTDGLQGAALYCLLLLGRRNAPEVKMTADYLREHCQVVWDSFQKQNKGGTDNPFYAWYYQTQAMFRLGGSYWREWNRRFAKEIIRNQQQEGYWICPNASPRTVAYERFYSTTMALLTLEVYYRYLPSSGEKS